MRSILAAILFVATQTVANEHTLECMGVEPTWKLTRNKTGIALTLDAERPGLRYEIKTILHTSNSNLATLVRASLVPGPTPAIDAPNNRSEFQLLLKSNPKCRLEADLSFDFEAFLLFEDFILHGCCRGG